VRTELNTRDWNEPSKVLNARADSREEAGIGRSLRTLLMRLVLLALVSLVGVSSSPPRLHLWAVYWQTPSSYHDSVSAIDLTTSERVTLDRFEAGGNHAVTSQDGRYIAYDTATDFHVLDVATRTIRQLPRHLGRGPLDSPTVGLIGFRPGGGLTATVDRWPDTTVVEDVGGSWRGIFDYQPRFCPPTPIARCAPVDLWVSHQLFVRTACMTADCTSQRMDVVRLAHGRTRVVFSEEHACPQAVLPGPRVAFVPMCYLERSDQGIAMLRPNTALGVTRYQTRIGGTLGLRGGVGSRSLYAFEGDLDGRSWPSFYVLRENDTIQRLGPGAAYAGLAWLPDGSLGFTDRFGVSSIDLSGERHRVVHATNATLLSGYPLPRS
jgi:hypothetical protein